VTTLRSPMPAEAVRRALEQARDGGRFVGRVGPMSFELREPSESGRGVKPTIRGRVLPLERGSELRLVCRLHPVMAVAGTTSFLTVAWPILAAFGAEPFPWHAVVISLLIALFCSLAVAGFLEDARTTEKRIGQLIQGRLVKTDGRPNAEFR
jgi:hypothetical protein